MHPVIHKTLGGLSMPYYLRHLFFGVLMSAFVFFATHRSPTGDNSIWSYAFIILNAFIYPYARFVYESVVSFMMGDNVFYLNALIMLFFKFMTIAMCWVFAIFIAPVGLLYLYFYHSRREA